MRLSGANQPYEVEFEDGLALGGEDVHEQVSCMQFDAGVELVGLMASFDGLFWGALDPPAYAGGSPWRADRGRDPGSL